MRRRTAAVLMVAELCSALALHAAVPLRWTVETSRVEPVQLNAVRGETLALEAVFQSYGRPFSMSGRPCAIFWQTNGMGSAWWTAPAIATSNRVSATFTPAMDVGAPVVRGFLGATGENYRAVFSVRFIDGPGATPNALPLPVPVIDFAQITVLNPPWENSSAEPGNYAAVSNAAIYASNRVETAVQPGDISGKANKSEMSVANGTGANADKTTITLRQGVSATVLRKHQSLAGVAWSNDLNYALVEVVPDEETRAAQLQDRAVNRITQKKVYDDIRRYMLGYWEVPYGLITLYDENWSELTVPASLGSNGIEIEYQEDYQSEHVLFGNVPLAERSPSNVSFDAETHTITLEDSAGNTVEATIQAEVSYVFHCYYEDPDGKTYFGDVMVMPVEPAEISVGSFYGYELYSHVDLHGSSQTNNIASLALPPSVEGKSRDLLIAASVESGTTLTAPSGVSYIPSAPTLDDGAIVRLTEVSNNVFAVQEIGESSIAENLEKINQRTNVWNQAATMATNSAVAATNYTDAAVAAASTSSTNYTDAAIEDADTSYRRFAALTNINQSVQFVTLGANETTLAIELPANGKTKDWIVYVLATSETTLTLPPATWYMADKASTNAIPAGMTALYFSQMANGIYLLGRQELEPVTIQGN